MKVKNIFFENEFLRSLEKLELVVKKTINSGLQGKHSSNNLGGGLEFNDYRQYQPGDDYRYLDWNLYSRLGQLFLKQFTEEREIIIYFLIDKSKSMTFGQPSKFTWALKIAAALGYITLSQLDRVGCCFYGEKLAEESKAGKGKKRFFEYFEFLSQAEAGGKTNINQALAEFSYKYKKPGLVVVLSDFLDDQGYQKGLRKLREKHWRVFLIQTLAREEIAPELEGEINLIDAETQKAKEVAINQEIIIDFQKKVEEYCLEISNFTKKYDMQYFKFINDQNIEDLIFKTLRRQEGIR